MRSLPMVTCVTLLALGLTTVVTAQGTWSQVESPAARDSAPLVYDAVRGRVVMFGGKQSGPVTPPLFGDTWEWYAGRWHRMSPTVSPSARTGHAMTFDTTRNRVLLFGGTSVGAGAQLFGDTWEWDGTNWTQRIPAAAPSARTDHAMTFDVIRGVAVLQGGRDAGGLSAETWEWNGATWTQVALISPAPAVEGHEMVFDVFRSRTVLFGGETVSGASAETWELVNAAWSQVMTNNAPGVRLSFAMVLDVYRQRTTVFGGYSPLAAPLNDVWLYDGAGAAWSQAFPTGGPSGRYECKGTLDQATQQMLVFGGTSTGGLGGIPNAELWGWDGTAWSDLWSDPRFRSGHAIADDPMSGGVVLFGGDDGRGNLLDQTSSFDGTRWHARQPSLAPSGRKLAAMALDRVRNRVLLFGGYNGQTTLADTWEWDGVTWAQRSPAASPPRRQGHALAWDPVGQRVLLFGGIQSSVLADTWAWDGTNWAQLAPTTVPPARARHGMASAPERGRVVMFGGVGTAYLDDTWEWQGSNWVQAQPVQAPTGRRGFAIAHDPRRGRTVIHGGANGLGRLGDTWEWDGANWSMRPGAAPSLREAHAMAFDSTHGQLVAFGGEHGPTFWGDTWRFGSAVDAGYAPFGAGCGGALGPPTLAADGYSLPWLGSSFTARASNLPSPIAAVMYIGVSMTSWGGSSLPLDLSVIGMGGCQLLVGADIAYPFTPAPPGSATWTLPIANVPVLAGLVFYNQALVLDQPANFLGLTMTNGVAATIGIR